jgi:hypothetical protein
VKPNHSLILRSVSTLVTEAGYTDTKYIAFRDPGFHYWKSTEALVVTYALGDGGPLIAVIGGKT